MKDYKVGKFTGVCDRYGNKLYEGDLIMFSFGIPQIVVIAPVKFIKGKAYVLTENHNPKKCLLEALGEYVGEFEVIRVEV